MLVVLISERRIYLYLFYKHKTAFILERKKRPNICSCFLEVSSLSQWQVIFPESVQVQVDMFWGEKFSSNERVNVMNSLLQTNL